MTSNTYLVDQLESVLVQYALGDIDDRSDRDLALEIITLVGDDYQKQITKLHGQIDLLERQQDVREEIESAAQRTSLERQKKHSESQIALALLSDNTVSLVCAALGLPYSNGHSGTTTLDKKMVQSALKAALSKIGLRDVGTEG